MQWDDRLIKERRGCDATTSAALWAPHGELATCVRAYVTRSTVAAKLGELDRLNYFPAAPTCAITWFMQGDYAHMDLVGMWRVSFTAPVGKESAAADLDDSSWSEIPAPGHDLAMLLPRSPCMYRRHFTVDAAWKTAHDRVWLYVWDLNDTRSRRGGSRTRVEVFLNGKLIEEKPYQGREAHWVALDVSGSLQPGKNVLAVSLTQGHFAYRVYLSPHAPKQYPNLGPQRNAQWADLSDWMSWSRCRAIRRGAEMIRQVDPDRPITLMHPDEFSTGIKRIALDFGGVFHNTGYMAGGWGDMPAAQMSGVGLPVEAEPGSGAVDLPDFKRFMGRWMTEGIQGVDYFIHVGDILWKPQVKKYFEETLNLWHLLGKYHIPKAKVGLLQSDRVVRLGWFPWSYDANINLPSGYWAWNLSRLLLPDYERAALDMGDFISGNAANYPVLVDMNTSVLDEEEVARIEKWVRGGGIFITFVQTGRHTSAQKDAWPISKLTGYEVTHIDQHNAQGIVLAQRNLSLADGQKIFQGDWSKVAHANGLTLRKVAPECQDLMLWQDGGVAVGIRKLGKGCVIHNGVKFANDRGCDNPEALKRFFAELFQWAGVKRIPAAVQGVMMRHFVTNNGLYDVWALWNETNRDITTDLTFRDGFQPPSAIDANTYKAVNVERGVEGAKIPAIHFGEWETHVFLTPRGQLAAAPERWFALQRTWWQGTASPGKPIPPEKEKLAIDLTEGWTFKPLAESPKDAEIEALANPALDDSSWERRGLGIVNLPNYRDVRHMVFRRQFTVPAHWNRGRVELWVRTSEGTTYVDAGRVYFDGKPAHSWMGDGVPGMSFDGALKPGTRHVVTIEVRGTHSLLGHSRRRVVGLQAGSRLAREPGRPMGRLAQRHAEGLADAVARPGPNGHRAARRADRRRSEADHRPPHAGRQRRHHRRAGQWPRRRPIESRRRNEREYHALCPPGARQRVDPIRFSRQVQPTAAFARFF